MTKKIFKLIILTSAIYLPAVASAQNVGTIEDILELFQSIMRYAAGAVIGVGVVIFFFGIIKFIANAHNPAKRKEGINFIVYGLFSFFVITAIWAIVRLVGSIFNFNL